MKAVLSFFIWLIALLVLGILSWAIALYVSWPWWGGIFIFFGVIGAWFGVRLLRRLWYLSRSRVKLAASEAIHATGPEKPGALTELTTKWKEGIATLKQSSLRRFGNPIYALPWFMVVGESGVGKTSAITRSRLTSLNKSISQFEPIVQTLNCDWWFFNRAVVIDTAGRYVSPDATEEDQAEWERMLELLTKYRLKEGLNGLVLAIEADLLLGNTELLDRRGHAVRQRIDQLIRLFDKRFPIFVMVTKCDQIFGFEQWAQILPADALNQAMGYTGTLQEGDKAEQRFLDAAFAHTAERLKRLRLDMAVKGVDLSPELLVFPSEFEQLQPGLERFLGACAGNNPYLEQPLLRGLFFSSAQQTGSSLPGALSHLLQSPQTAHAPTDKGLFLHDFFERVLPADRWTFLPTVIVNRWHQITRNLAAVFWISAFTAALAFVFLSYYQTRASLIDIRRAYPEQPLISEGNGPEQLETLQRIVSVIELIEAREAQWQTRWLAFSPDITELEEDIKEAYVRSYQGFLQTARPNLPWANAAKPPANDPGYANTVLALVRNINLSQARVQGADYKQLLAMPQIPVNATTRLFPELPEPVAERASQLLVAYKAWSPENDPFLQQRLIQDRETLRTIVTQSPHMEWLLPWANTLPGLQPVSLREFWLPGTQGSDRGMIEPALTRQGELRLQAFLTELEQAFNDPVQFQQRRSAFEQWYLAERINTWQSFAWSFTNGEELLNNEPAWREMLGRIDTDASPYFVFFERLKSEFAEVPAARLPRWLMFAREFNTMRQAATATSSFDKARGMLGTLNTVGERAIQQSVSGQSLSPLNQFPQSIQGVQRYGDYARAFDVAAAEALGGDGKAYQLAADYFSFSADASVKTSALQTVHDNLEAFRRGSGFNSPDDQIIWHLLGGPSHLLMRYLLEQGSCHAQKEWESDVLWKTQMAVSPREVNEQLFGDKGSVWTFADGPAKPFIRQYADGFRATAYQGYTFPFSPGFIPFLNQSVSTRVESVVKARLAEASVGKSANLLITSRPIGVNPGARAKPYAVNLSIQCAQEQITLDNFNMDITNSFNWSPDQCGDVSLQIRIDNLLLNRRYPGPMGMARFVEEFVDGERIFTPEDFPQAREQLDALDVQTIHVRYDLGGQEALLEMASHIEYLSETEAPSIAATPSKQRIQVPERVGQCWMSSSQKQGSTNLPLYIRERATEIINTPPEPPEPERIQALAEAEAAAEIKATAASAPRVTREHRVQPGETLFSLAKRFGTTIEVLKSLNNISDTNLIYTGRLLKLPAGAGD